MDDRCAWDRVARRMVYLPRRLRVLIPLIEHRGLAWVLRQRRYAFVEALL